MPKPPEYRTEDRAIPCQTDAAILDRLRKLEGQVRGVYRLIEENAPCDKVVTQLAAIKGALDQAGLHYVTEHLRTCIAKWAKGGDADPVEQAVRMFLKLR